MSHWIVPKEFNSFANCGLVALFILLGPCRNEKNEQHKIKIQVTNF